MAFKLPKPGKASPKPGKNLLAVFGNQKATGDMKKKPKFVKK